MRQFDVVRNPERVAAAKIPYLVVLQHDHVQPAPSVIVVSYDMASITHRRLGSPIDNLEAHRDQFIAAIDLLFTGF